MRVFLLTNLHIRYQHFWHYLELKLPLSQTQSPAHSNPGKIIMLILEANYFQARSYAQMPNSLDQD